MLDDAKYMELALEQARRAARHGEVPVGAVLVDKKGQILARACNMSLRQCDPTAHAEILVLRQGAERFGSYRLTDTTLYVTIEPCPMCAGAMVLARIGRLAYGAEDPKAGACGTLYNIVQDPRLNHRLEVSRGILAEDCRLLIQTFFQKKRK
ncbi:MAG: tRNA adenosine(34) deaminase TadA [Deltaproteobacteria bacterium]|nr:tRNA adenosine(34) deaminase TadA [Deltaproteobacteria bacterium]MBW1966532.1 tRNA adenosine(34) deaminase TadA [Deltaproteobacteria bacterium]MBW2097888.1 tRNA adenosine(34) deaminase TadA [Deltaproteobacteria bacterium]PXF55210.1 MAG: tRNA adenosine(34) deaminase TadA [Deltaproteobacteria bacterium]RKX58973.1 MAG: tRNA adenosine(34) deaminase TadA [Thermodesulfobacteriota bacterium]